MVSRIGKSKIMVPLSKNLSYLVFAYDRKFFFISDNPKATTGNSLELKDIEKNVEKMFFKVEIVEHEQLNLQRQPCIKNDDFSFGDCIRLYLESKAKCRLPWHAAVMGRGNSRICSSLEEFKMFDEGYSEFTSSELKDVKKITGCKDNFINIDIDK